MCNKGDLIRLDSCVVAGTKPDPTEESISILLLFHTAVKKTDMKDIKRGGPDFLWADAMSGSFILRKVWGFFKLKQPL